MAKSATEKAEVIEPTDIVPAGVNGGAMLPSEMLSEMEALAGVGVSMAADDSIVPFLTILQDLSPEAKKRDPAYIEGAEPGMILLKGLKLLWKPDDVLEVQPCAFQKLVVEWVPRDNGGGFVGRHESMPSNAQKKQDGKRTRFYNPENGNEYVETRYHYVNILGSQGLVMPAVISFSSTGHQVSRQWTAHMKAQRFQGSSGQWLIAPSFAKKYRVKPVLKSNAQGEWFVPEFEDTGYIRDRGVIASGKELHDSVMSGRVVAAEEEVQSASGSGDSDEDIPV